MRTFVVSVLTVLLALKLILTVSTAQWGATGGADRAPPNHSLADLCRIANETRQLDDAVRRLRIFQEDLARTKSQLLDGQLSLAAAGERLAASVEANNPPLLQFLKATNPGATSVELMVNLMKRHFDLETSRGRLTQEQDMLLACLWSAYDYGRHGD